MGNEVNIKKNILWNTIGSVFYSGCQWLITILVIRLSNYEMGGYLSLAMTTSSSFSAISLFSMRNYQVSDVNREYSCNVYVGSRITTCIIAFISCSISAFFGNSLYQVLCIIAFMLVRVAEALVDVLHGENQYFDRYDLIGKSYIMRGILTVATFSVLLKVTFNLPLTLFVMAICNLFIAIFYDWRMTGKLEKIKPILMSKEVLDLLKKCAPIVVFSFLLSLENLIPKNVLQQVLGTEQLGIYSAIATPTLVVQVCASVAFNPLLPRFSRAYLDKDYDGFLRKLRKTYIGFVGITVAVMAGAILLGRPVLSILLGEGILEHYYLFYPIVMVTVLTAIIWIVSSLVIALRKIIWLLIGMIVDFAICYFITGPCIEAFGKNGVSIIQLIVYSIYIIFMVVLCEFTVHKEKRESQKNEQ